LPPVPCSPVQAETDGGSGHGSAFFWCVWVRDGYGASGFGGSHDVIESVGAGDQAALEHLAEQVYAELRSMARHACRAMIDSSCETALTLTGASRMHRPAKFREIGATIV
jgi:hypothetical protein